MGVYAEAVRARGHGWQQLPEELEGPAYLVYSTRSVARTTIEACLPGTAPTRVLAYGDGPAGSPEIISELIRPETGLEIPQETAAWISAHTPTLVLLDGLENTRGSILPRLRRCGIERVVYRAQGKWRETGIARIGGTLPWFLDWKAWRDRWRFARRGSDAGTLSALLSPPLRDAGAEPPYFLQNAWAEHSARVLRASTVKETGALRVDLLIHHLNSGGAEQQLCILASGLAAAGHDVRVLTVMPARGEDGHYRARLEDEGIWLVEAGREATPGAVDALLELDLSAEFEAALPRDIRDLTLDVAGELVADPPDILHCFLDPPNVIGALAGLMAGTPHILQSGRNVSPIHFPQFMSPWFYDGYRCVLGFPHIRFSTNSVPGAQDYARWLSMDFDPASVVVNGLSPEAFDDPCPEQLSTLRRELGMPADFGDETPILVGVFRLSDEKQPLFFVDVAAEITRRVPGLQVVIAGTGPMQQQVEKAIRKNGVEQNVKLLGQRDDVLSLLRVADVMLLASRFEGTPNVILEALAAGCPPVATRVGGVTELIDSGVTGYLHDPGDREGLIESVTRLLREPALRSQMGKAGRRDASERFSRGRLVEETVALYRRVMSQRDERAAITSADN